LSGTPVANFSLATNEKFKDGNDERQERTEWHSIVASSSRQRNRSHFSRLLESRMQEQCLLVVVYLCERAPCRKARDRFKRPPPQAVIGERCKATPWKVSWLPFRKD
jgi:hypothetical protein